MIENWRYQRAIQPDPHKTLAKRLDIEFLLQQRMKLLGISPELSPRELISIDELITKNADRRQKRPIVEVLGMPRTGKTTVLKKISETPVVHNYQLISDTFHQMSSVDSDGEKHIISYLNLCDQLPKNKKFIIERGIIDKIIYSTVWSLYGKINVVSDITSSWIDRIKMSNDFSLVILCLTKPETCQQRGSKTPIHILKSLYEQYLLLHFDILASERIPKYIALDLDEDNIERNHQKLYEAIIQNL
jgi:hypothetical protein